VTSAVWSKSVAVGLLVGGLLGVGAGRTPAFQGAGRSPADTESLFHQGPRIDPDPAGRPTVAELAEARVRAARQYLEATQTFFEQGTINIDRLIAASRCLMESERDAAGTRAGEVAALRSHAERMKKIVERERAKFEVGSGSIPNVQEAEYHRREAEYWLARTQAGQDEVQQGRGDRPGGGQPVAVGPGLAALVPAGMRAIAVRVSDATVGHPGLIVPKNRVDVLFTPHDPDPDAPSGGRTTTVLQNVEILAVERRRSAGREGQRGLRSVTLLVTPEQAAKLDRTQDEGVIRLSLRNPKDVEPTPDRP
jgi:hypothetical protein